MKFKEFKLNFSGLDIDIVNAGDIKSIVRTREGRESILYLHLLEGYLDYINMSEVEKNFLLQMIQKWPYF